MGPSRTDTFDRGEIDHENLTFALIVALATCVAGQAFAKEHYRESSVKADTKEAFEKLADSVREGMQPAAATNTSSRPSSRRSRRSRTR